MSTGQRAENESGGSNTQRNLKRAVDFRQSQKTHAHKKPHLSRLLGSVESNETVQQAPSSQELDEQTERDHHESYSTGNQEEIEPENGSDLEENLKVVQDCESNSLTQIIDLLKEIRNPNQRDRENLQLLSTTALPSVISRCQELQKQLYNKMIMAYIDLGRVVIERWLNGDTFDEELSVPSTSSVSAQMEEFSREYGRLCQKSLEEVADGCNVKISSKRRFEQMQRIGCEKIKKISALQLNQDPNPIKRIIACMKFNRSGNFFATVGTSKRIKLYNFNFVLESNSQEIYPTNLSDSETATSSYISSLSWSQHANNIMITSDYRGHVLLWDVDEVTPIYRWREHTTRVWSVDFNHFNETLFASGSDDFTVKLYNTKEAGSTSEISLSKNVCSVEFSPFEENQLLIGSSNKTAVIYDIRNTSEPLKVFEGHDRTVSYAQFLSRDEIVTASIDSTVRVWDVNDGTCKRVLNEHHNRKYFTGLANKDGYILCGSEDSTVYLYHKDHPSSKHSYKIREEGVSDFISSICWKEDSNYALVANDQGRLHVLQIN